MDVLAIDGKYCKKQRVFSNPHSFIFNLQLNY